MTLVCAQTAVCLALTLSGALDRLQPPPLEQMPLSLTSYWLFDDNGRPVAWDGQADGDPDHYANMQTTSAADASRVGACIGEWVTLGWTTAVSFTWQGRPYDVACFDAFGLESYRRPFFHDRYGVWVIPVDILSPEPLHGLVWEWQTAVVNIAEVAER